MKLVLRFDSISAWAAAAWVNPRPFPPRVLEVPSGTRLGELLKLLELGDMEEELIMVADGASACRSDRLEKSGTLLLLPVICGG